MAVDTQPGKGLYLQAGEQDWFAAFLAITVFPGFDALQSLSDLLELLHRLVLAGQGHLLLLNCVDSGYPSNRLLIQRNRPGRFAAQIQLVFEILLL